MTKKEYVIVVTGSCVRHIGPFTEEDAHYWARYYDLEIPTEAGVTMEIIHIVPPDYYPGALQDVIA